MREGTERNGEPGDGAVSPVIAVILMVAITVVLAATVYVWVSGFTDTGDQAPTASFRHVSCDATANSDDNITVRMNSGGPIQEDDVAAVLFNQSTDSEEARTDPLSDGGGQGYDAGQWNTGEQKTFSENSNEDYQWDSNLANDLDDGNPYELNFIHKPTDSTFATLPFTC